MMLGTRIFWGRQQSAFFDIRVPHPNAPSYCYTLFQRYKLEKIEYGDCVILVLLNLHLLHPLLVALAGRPPFLQLFS